MAYKDPAAARANHAAHYAAHAEENRAKARAYRASHREESRAYAAAHREKKRVQSRARYTAQREEKLTKRRAYDARRAEIIQTQRLAWKAAHPEDPQKVRARNVAYRLAHRAEIIAQRHQRYRDNHEAILEKRRAYVRAHHEEVLAQKRAAQELNRQHCAQRRARKLAAAVVDLTAAQWTEIKAAYDHRCVYCDRQMARLTMDHITPLAKGGSHTASNVVPACRACNAHKHTGPPPVPVQPVLLTLAPAKAG